MCVCADGQTNTYYTLITIALLALLEGLKYSKPLVQRITIFTKSSFSVNLIQSTQPPAPALLAFQHYRFFSTFATVQNNLNVVCIDQPSLHCKCKPYVSTTVKSIYSTARVKWYIHVHVVVVVVVLRPW